MWTYYNDGTRNHEIDIELPDSSESPFGDEKFDDEDDEDKEDEEEE